MDSTISKKFTVIEAPIVLVNLVVKNLKSSAEVSKKEQELLLAAVAASVGVSDLLVTIDSIQSLASSRRLLDVSFTVKILAVDSEDALNVQKKVDAAYIQVLFSQNN